MLVEKTRGWSLIGGYWAGKYLSRSMEVFVALKFYLTFTSLTYTPMTEIMYSVVTEYDILEQVK